MQEQAAKLLLLEDLEDASKTKALAESDRNALNAVALDQDLRRQASQGHRPRWARVSLRAHSLGA